VAGRECAPRLACRGRAAGGTAVFRRSRLSKNLRRYAADQLNWILGLNPFDVSMLHGSGRNNPEYIFFGTYQYRNAPGGICNGITSGFKDESDIDFNLMKDATGGDNEWRWGEQWLPHTAWYLLAVAARDVQNVPF